MLLQQPDHREGQPGRHQRGALLVDVAAVEDGADDRGVRRRPADLALLELADQRRLGVAGRRLRLVARRPERGRRHRVALVEGRQPGLAVVGVALVVAALDVRLEEAVEGDHPARGGEDHVLAGRGGAAEPDRDRTALGVGHLRGDGAHPDQLVEPELLPREPGLRRGAEVLTGRPDRLVGLLGVLDLRGVGARLVRDVLGAVQLAGLLARRGDRGLRERRGVGAHVGDEAVLVEPLRDGHRPRGAEPELAGGLLLQRRGAERRVGLARVGLGLDRADLEGGLRQRGGQRLGAGPVEVDDVGALLEPPQRGEVGAAGDARPVDGVQLGREHPLVVAVAGVEGALEVPVRRGAERDPLPLAVDDQPGRHGLDPAGGEAGHDLLPQHRGDLVAVEPVEDPPGLLGLDEVHVDVAGRLDGGLDRLLGDLVEDHPADRHLGLELVEEVPGDGLALAVLVGGEEELGGVLEQPLELGHVRLLVAGHHVVGGEVVVDVHAEPRPRLALDLGRDVGGALREVADVPDGGLHDVVAAEVARDRLRLGGRLDDDELAPGPVVSCHVCSAPRYECGPAFRQGSAPDTVTRSVNAASPRSPRGPDHRGASAVAAHVEEPVGDEAPDLLRVGVAQLVALPVEQRRQRVQDLTDGEITVTGAD